MSDIIKILSSSNPHEIILNLDNSGILETILPELTDLKGQEFIDGKGHKDNFLHCVQVLKQTSEVTNDIWIRFLALLHDIGKAPTKKFDPVKGWTFHNHEEVSVEMVKPIFERLDIDISYLEHMENLVRYNGQVKDVVGQDISDSAVRRFITQTEGYTFDLTLFAKCDITTKYDWKREKFVKEIEELEDRIRKLIISDKEAKWRPPIDGKDIMEFFGIQPGKEVGDIMKSVISAIKSNQIEETRESCIEYLKQLK